MADPDRFYEFSDTKGGTALPPSHWIDLTAVIAIKTTGDAVEFVLLSGVSHVLPVPPRAREPLVTRWKAVREAYSPRSTPSAA